MKAFPRRTTVLMLGAALAAAGAAGCGGDDDDGSASSDAPPRPASLAVEMTGSGKNAKLSLPASVPAGVTTISFKNSTGEQRAVQLGRVDAGHEPAELLKAGNAWASDGKPLPPWAHTEGGTPPTEPGQTSKVTQNLAPGRYVAFDTEADGEPPSAPFEVTGEPASDALPEPRARIDMKEYSFAPTGLTAGRQQILIDNQGREPHFVAAAPIKEGKTIDDVRKFIQTRKGAPPIDEANSVGTAVLDGGRSQVVDLELKSGNYALLCFVPDRKGGPPHAVKGMISAATVE